MEMQWNCNRTAILNEKEQEYLKALFEYKYLTSSLFKKLFNEKSIRTVRYRLHELWTKNFVRRIRLPHLVGEGSPELIYILNRKGFNIVKNDCKFVDFEKTDKCISPQSKGIFQLKHLLSVNSFIVSLEISTRQFDVEIIELKAYYNRPITLEAHDVHFLSRTLIPDAMFVLFRNGKRALFFLEADRGTEPLRSFLNKKRSNISQKIEIYTKILETESFLKLGEFKGFRVLIVTPDIKRLNNIKYAISEMADNRCFWLTTESEIKGKNILSDAIWHVSGKKNNNVRTLIKV